jgi:anti-sigma factor RsiW
MRRVRCTQARKHLSAYQDGALSERQRVQVREHVAQCPHCAALAAEYQQAWELLDRGETVDTSPGFVAGVIRRVQAAAPAVWQAPRWAVAAALAICLACGGLAGYVHSGASEPAAVSQVALATDVSRQLGIEAFAPAPGDTLAGAYAQLAGNEQGR